MKNIFFILLSVCVLFSINAQVVDDSVRSVESWESGGFESYRWERPGSRYLWEVTTQGTRNGRFCARSGNYYANSTESVLQLAVLITDSGAVSYQRRVFSERNYDFFRFYIDGVLMEEVSGNVPWGEFSCPVSAGYHQLKFVYHKDGSIKVRTASGLTMSAGPVRPILSSLSTPVLPRKILLPHFKTPL